jgi:hypothetical protein
MSQTIADGLQGIINAKSNIDGAIEAKGGIVTKGLENSATDIGTIPIPPPPVLIDKTITENGTYYSGDETVVTSSTFPVVVNDSNGTPVRHVDINGNTVQSGTPTSDNPIIPQGTGDMTGNLFNENRVETTTWSIDTKAFIIGCYANSKSIASVNIESYSIGKNQITVKSRAGGCGIGVIVEIESNKTYTLSFDTSKEIADNSSYFGFNTVSSNGSLGEYIAPLRQKVYTFNSGSAKYAYIVFRVSPQFGEMTYSNIMLNSGSTALPYEPYGCKLDISSGDTTTPVYLGEVPTTRKIGKIDLGTLNWSKVSSGNFLANTAISGCKIIGNSSAGNAICTHFSEAPGNEVANTPYSFCSCLNNQARPFINKAGFENLTVEEFKEAMSGVYMYYVLTEPETGIVNEPLMKIGDYADSLSVDVELPLSQNTENNIDIDTTVKPSSASFTYNKLSDYIGYNEINVDVSNTYTAEDEGKVVSSGELIPQTAMPTEITENGTVDTTLFNSVDVNIPDPILVEKTITSNGTYDASTDVDNVTLTNQIPPVTIPDSNGDNIVSLDVFGNEQHTGTPTPDSPIIPQGTGERTAQLFDGTIVLQDVGMDSNRYGFTITKAGTYTVNITGVIESGDYCYGRTYSNGEWSQFFYLTTGGTKYKYTVSISENEKLVIFNASGAQTEAQSKAKFDRWKIMANTGSAALPYEPYGYKAPISSANTTTPVYLGEVETTRKIKKLVLTGEETWQLWNGNYYSTIIDRKGAISTILCTHFINSGPQGISYSNQSTAGLKIASAAVPFVSDLSGLKEWLAAQYAAGTPVTVWYVLAEPTTGVVNEPLMKIGDYADQLSLTNSQITIPTSQGENTISIDTIVQPSSMNISYNRDIDGYSSVIVNVPDIVGHTFIVATIPNAIVTVTNASNTYTETADNVGEALFKSVAAGTYDVTATYDDAVSDTTSITIADHTVTEDSFATLTISASANTAITITDGTVTKTLTYTGTPIVQYVSLGTWDLSCVIDDTEITQTVLVDSYTNQNITLMIRSISRYVDFTTNTTTITGNPDTYPVYMGINRCNVSDDGTINAYYGDASYAEDGSNGQVMVKIPKFYYKVTPDEDGGLDGVNIRKCTWEISETPDDGFTLHPAFYDANGNEIDYFLYGAFDGVGQRDSTYGTSYNKSTDKLSSVAGSSYLPTNSLKRATARAMATNRGTGWYSAGVKQTMAVQMLFAVEYGFNSQIAVGQGVVSASAATYAGQTTGNITSGTQDNKTTPVNWRGIENLWGNILDWIDGLNVYERTPYFCNTYTFVDNTSTGYTQISFSLPSTNYVTAFGYDSTNDWVLLPSESSSTDNTTGPIGDYVFSYSGWRVALLGGLFTYDSNAGAFFWVCGNDSSSAGGGLGARLMFIPTAD